MERGKIMDERQQTRRQNIEQERGRVAWTNIREIRDLQSTGTSKAETVKKEYRSIARGLNSMIQINGLGPTLGFLKAKGTVKGKRDENKAHSKLLKHIDSWMSGFQYDQDSAGKEDVQVGVVSNQHNKHYHFSVSNREALSSEDGLLGWITDPGTSSSDYRRATTEVLAFGNWLRRFAEAELEGEDNV